MKKLSDQRKKFLVDDYCQGFVAYCGFQPEDIAWGHFTSSLAIRNIHRQQDGFIHAGVLATMADHTAGYAGFTVAPEGYQILTIEFKVNFLRPAYGQKVTCESHVLKPGKSVIVAESNLFDHRGDQWAHTAKATITLMAVPWEKLRKETRT